MKRSVFQPVLEGRDLRSGSKNSDMERRCRLRYEDIYNPTSPQGSYPSHCLVKCSLLYPSTKRDRFLKRGELPFFNIYFSLFLVYSFSNVFLDTAYIELHSIFSIRILVSPIISSYSL